MLALANKHLKYSCRHSFSQDGDCVTQPTLSVLPRKSPGLTSPQAKTAYTTTNMNEITVIKNDIFK